MNIRLQLCGIVVIVTLLVLFLSHRSLKLRSQMAFLFTLVTMLIALVLDTLSVVVIVQSAENVTLFTRIACKAYLVSLAAAAFATNYYMIAEMDFKSRAVKKLRIGSHIMLFVLAVLIVAAPISVHYGGPDDLYTYGPSVMLTYATAFLYTLINGIILIVYRRQVDLRRLSGAGVLIFLVIIAAVAQLLNNQWLLIGFVSSIGMLIMYIRLENPESYYEKESGMFNQQAFMAFLSQSYSRGRSESMVVIRIRNMHYIYERFPADEVKVFLHSLEQTMQALTKGYVFKYSENEYIIVCADNEKYDETAQSLAAALERDWLIAGESTDVDFMFTQVPDTSITTDAQTMREIMRSFRQEHDIGTETLFTIDKMWAERCEGQRDTLTMITAAIREGRVTVYYQPIYSVEKQRYVSAEALVRIKDRDGSIIPPYKFVPAAESSGLISDLGRIVFESACRLISGGELEKYGIEYLEVNLSAVQCVDRGLADDFIGIMKQTNADPKMINLEITESSAIRSTTILLSNMNKLCGFGVSFSLDDFGTGFSNLDYLIGLPIKIVKFDRKMTQAYFINSRSRDVMDGIIATIKNVGLEIVAEGVEEKDQLDELAEKKIDFIQGYYFSKPVPEEKFLELLKNNGTPR